MIPLKISSNGAFIKRIEERRRKWAGLQEIAARIRVSEKLRWWVYQEYGTFHVNPYPDPRGEQPGLADVWRRNSNALYAVKPDGSKVFFLKVPVGHWRPTKAKHMVGRRMSEVQSKVRGLFRAEFEQGLFDNPERLQELTRTATEQAKESLVGAFADAMGSTGKEDGNLKGQAAWEAFEEDAKVVETE